MHRSLTTLTVITLAAMLIAALSTATGASAAVTCAKWASTGGSDANPGTQAAPYRSLGTLAASLQPGQTGCLPAGQTYYAVAGNGFVGGTSGTSAAPVTITSGPGGRATVMGQIELKPESHDVVLTGLDFKGGYAPGGVPFYTKQTHLLAAGDRISIVDNDISDPRGICVGAGHGHATAATPNDVAEDLKITGNRIHDCGMAPDIAWGPNDSGSHGIYLENTLRARISDNLIFRNRWRGLQLWPKNDGAVIERNLFDENATHVNIGSSLGEYGGTFKAQNTIVRDNILTGRVTDFVPSQNPSQVYGFFPEGSPTYGNQVSGNCFAPGDAPEATGAGFALGANTVAQAQFANRSERDYRLQSSSPCIGKGPASVQPAPVGQPDRGVTVSAAASAVTGDEVTVTAKVLNRTAAAGSVNVAIAAANAKLLGVSAAGLSCTMSACSGTLAANATVTISATLGATSAGSATLTARLTDADSTPNDNTATATTSVTGPACTYAGTSGADSAQGSAANEVFCLFGGDDTVTPGAGGDTIIGGAGTDRLSYWNAAGAVVINLGQSAAWDAGAGTAIGWDTYRGIEWATGSAYADTLVGSAGSDILDGLEGTDEIWGYGGNDTLKGWVGNDRLYGGDGNDTLDGGDGTDSCDQGLGTGTKTACEA